MTGPHRSYSEEEIERQLARREDQREAIEYGFACLGCGATGGPMVPVGTLPVGESRAQVFAHPYCEDAR